MDVLTLSEGDTILRGVISMLEWKNDKELFAIIKKELFNEVYNTIGKHLV